MKIVSIKDNLPILEEHSELNCGDKEIVVKLEACGICGSDIGNIFEKSSKPTKKIGHEISGIIYEVGREIIDLKIGDRIIINHHCSCQKCHLCTHGNETMCEKFTEEIEPCGLAEKFLVSNWIIENKGVFKIPDDMSFKEATLIEPFACCLRSWKKIQVKKDDSVMIFGFGTIGIFHSIIAKEKKLNKIIVDYDDFRLNFGKKENLGEDFLNINNSNFEEFKKFYEKIDLAIIANSDISCLNEAINVVRKGGTILFFGEPKANSKTKIDLSKIYSKEIKITTSYASTNQDFQEAMKIFSEKHNNFNKLITHEFTLENAQEAIKFAKDGKNRIKVIISSNN